MGTQLQLLPGNPTPAMHAHNPLPPGLGIVAWGSSGPSPSPTHLHVLCAHGGLLVFPAAARKAESQALGWSSAQARSSQEGFGGILTSFGRGALSPSPHACSSLPGNLLLYSFQFLPLLRHLNSQLHSGS